MTTQFNTTNNKGFLWNLMLEADVFGGVPPSKKDSVVEIFEQVMNEVGFNNTGNLIEMNKAVIMRVNNRLNPLREKEEQSPLHSSEPPKLVTSAEISASRQEKFAVNLSERQRQFDDMMIAKKPEELDFTDKDDNEKPIGAEMDDMLAKMMARREQQLNQVMQGQDTNAAQNWISNEGSGSNTGPPTLQIGEEVNKPKVEEVNSQIKAVKPKMQRVSFAESNDQIEENDEDSDILSLFKTKERAIDKDALSKRIEEIETKVSELMNLLSVLKKTII